MYKNQLHVCEILFFFKIALTLCAGQGKQDFEQDLRNNISKLKKLRWYKKQEIIRAKRIEAVEYIKVLKIDDHFK